jgi:hypothetical protein
LRSIYIQPKLKQLFHQGGQVARLLPHAINYIYRQVKSVHLPSLRGSSVTSCPAQAFLFHGCLLDDVEEDASIRSSRQEDILPWMAARIVKDDGALRRAGSRLPDDLRGGDGAGGERLEVRSAPLLREGKNRGR